MSGSNEDRLQARIRALEARLADLQSRYDRLRTRRSVRAALAMARAAGRLRRPPPSSSLAVEAPPVDPGPILSQRLAQGPSEGPMVSIVMLTRDGREHLERLLPALDARTTYRSFELIVIDNASTDGSDELLAKPWSFPLRWVRNEENVSFSRGCNQGAGLASGDLLLLLNNDVVPMSPGWLGGMVTALEEGAEAVGAVLIHPPETGGGVQHEGIGFRTVDGMPRPVNVSSTDPLAIRLDSTRVAPAATAACLLTPLDLYRTVGGLDERYEYGMEDVDFCLRLGEGGRRIVVTGQARLHHHESSTVSKLDQAHWRASRLANRRLFEERWGVSLRRSMAAEALEPDRFLVPGRRRLAAITVTENDPDAGWGDWYTAHELGTALEKVGWEVVYAEARDDAWYGLVDEVALVVGLIDRFDARQAPPDAVCVAWVRNWTDRWATRPWLARYDAVIPSSRTSRDLLAVSGVTPGPVLPLATNPDRFRPGLADPDLACDIAFTGNHWGVPRSALEHLGPAPGLAVYGRGWADVSAWRGNWRGQQPYDRMPAVYGSAKIVLDDTAGPTLPYGALNSRVFDAVAAGALVITNNRLGSEEVFNGKLPSYTSGPELRALVDRYLGDDELRVATVDALRQVVLGHHTYDRRVGQLLEATGSSVSAPRVAILVDGDGGDGTAHAVARRIRDQRRAHVRVLPRGDWESPWARTADLAVHRIGPGEPAPAVEGRSDLWWGTGPAPGNAYRGFAGDPIEAITSALSESQRPGT